MLRNFFIIFALIGVGLIAYIAVQNQPFSLLKKTDSPVDEYQIKTLTLKGSNTVGESFAPRLAEAFLKSRGATLIKTFPGESNVEKVIEGLLLKDRLKIRIDIQAHGSTTGFKALAEQATQIAMSSRSIKKIEQESLTASFGEVHEHPIALDALAIITNPENPISELTVDQIAAIFAGEIDNWQQLGGNSQAISIFSRDENSGTWDTFKSLVLKPKKLSLSPQSARIESSADLVNQVMQTPGAIGFVGVAYVSQTRLIAVAKNTEQTASKPSPYTIGTQDYPLSRKLFFYTTGNESSPLAKQFIEFVTRNEGQKLAEETGLISYYPTHYQPKLKDAGAPRKYRELASLGRRITVNFNAEPSKVDQSKEQRDIRRLHNFAQQNPGKSIVLVDFSHSPRLAEIQSQLSDINIRVLDTLQIDYAASAGNIEVWVL